MLVRIMTRHPIATSAGPIEWSKARFEIDPRMLAEGGERLGKWLNEAMGKLGGFDFRPGRAEARTLRGPAFTRAPELASGLRLEDTTWESESTPEKAWWCSTLPQRTTPTATRAGSTL